jgi:hypothetical protein
VLRRNPSSLSRVETLGGTRKRGQSLQKNIGEVLLFYFFY